MQRMNARNGLIAAACVMAFGALAGPAAAQVGRFSGGGVVSEFNQACRDAGMLSATTAYTILYLPGLIGDNGNRDSLAFLAPWGTLSYSLEGRRFGTTFTTVTTSGIFHGPFTVPTNAPNAGRLRIIDRAPAQISARTRTAVRLSGEIQNWSGVRGCNVRFDAALGQDIR